MMQAPGKIPQHAQISEFDSGLDTIPKKDRKEMTAKQQFFTLFCEFVAIFMNKDFF